MQQLGNVTLAQIVIGVVAVLVVVIVSWVLWRILKRVIGGCISIGIGCLVLVVGLVAIGLFFASRLGISSFDDLLRLIGFHLP